MVIPGLGDVKAPATEENPRRAAVRPAREVQCVASSFTVTGTGLRRMSSTGEVLAA